MAISTEVTFVDAVTVVDAEWLNLLQEHLAELQILGAPLQLALGFTLVGEVAAGQQPAYNLTLMPGLVKNHDHAARLVESPFMAKLEEVMATDDVMVLVVAGDIRENVEQLHHICVATGQVTKGVFIFDLTLQSIYNCLVAHRFDTADGITVMIT